MITGKWSKTQANLPEFGKISGKKWEIAGGFDLIFRKDFA
jgi:hypothetical protein